MFLTATQTTYTFHVLCLTEIQSRHMFSNLFSTWTGATLDFQLVKDVYRHFSFSRHVLVASVMLQTCVCACIHTVYCTVYLRVIVVLAVAYIPYAQHVIFENLCLGWGGLYVTLSAIVQCALPANQGLG